MSKPKITKADVARFCAGAQKGGFEIATLELLLDESTVRITAKGSTPAVMKDDPELLSKLL